MLTMRFLVAAVVLAEVLSQSASAWPSPIDDKYRKMDGALYARYDDARDLLDRYAGESDFLDLGKSRLEYVLTKNERFAPAYMQLARLLILVDDEDGGNGFLAAERAIHKAIEIEPGYADAWVLQGYIDAHLGKHAMAIEALNKARSIGTENPWLEINLAEEDLMSGKDEEALQALDRISAKGTDSKKARGTIPEIYIEYYKKKNDLPKIDCWYRKQIADDPNDAWPHGNYAGFLVWHVGNFVEAEKQARAALALMDYGRGRTTLAASLYAQWASAPENKRSKAMFDEAVSLYPDIRDMADSFDDSAPTKALADALRKAAPSPRQHDVL